jgi:hypothetical protein
MKEGTVKLAEHRVKDIREAAEMTFWNRERTYRQVAGLREIIQSSTATFLELLELTRKTLFLLSLVS